MVFLIPYVVTEIKERQGGRYFNKMNRKKRPGQRHYYCASNRLPSLVAHPQRSWFLVQMYSFHFLCLSAFSVFQLFNYLSVLWNRDGQTPKQPLASVLQWQAHTRTTLCSWLFHPHLRGFKGLNLMLPGLLGKCFNHLSSLISLQLTYVYTYP